MKSQSFDMAAVNNFSKGQLSGVSFTLNTNAHPL